MTAHSSALANTGSSIRSPTFEYEHLHATIGRQEGVLGLDVAVDDRVVVGGGEAVGDRRSDLDGLPPGEPLAGDPLAQGLALEQLGDGVGDRALASDVVNGDFLP
jgi:hypothetical protein